MNYFNNLIFTPHPMNDMGLENGEQAWISLPNGYGVSIIRGFKIPGGLFEAEVYKRDEIQQVIEGYREQWQWEKPLSDLTCFDVDNLINQVAEFKPCYYTMLTMSHYIKKKGMLFFERELKQYMAYKIKNSGRKKEISAYHAKLRKEKRGTKKNEKY